MGTLGYEWDINIFLDKLPSVHMVINLLREDKRILKNMDSELISTMTSIKTPPGVTEKGFKIKCAVSDTGHPFSRILNDVSKKIEQMFTSLHSQHAPVPKESVKGTEFIRYIYLVCCYAFNRLNELNDRLTREGGRNIRSLDYFNVERFSVHARQTIKSVSNFSSQLGQDIKKLLNDIDSRSTNYFVS